MTYNQLTQHFGYFDVVCAAQGTFSYTTELDGHKVSFIFEESEESPGAKGLGILPGKVSRIPEGEGRKVPQIGWNDLTYPREGRLFEDVPEGSYVYFVHSYYLHADDRDIVTARTQYGVAIDASVEKDNVFACQFHPEKSERVGMQILRNFVKL